MPLLSSTPPIPVLQRRQKRSQLLCKVCSSTFQADNRLKERLKPNTSPALPICLILGKTLTRHYSQMRYCNCPHRLNALNKLNPAEKLTKTKIFSIQASLYFYREYLFQAAELVHPGPIKPLVDIRRIHNSQTSPYPVLLRVLRHLCPQNRLYYVKRLNIQPGFLPDRPHLRRVRRLPLPPLQPAIQRPRG